MIIIRDITFAFRRFQALFRKVLPPTGGAAGSFLAVGARFVVAAGAFAAGALRAGAAFFAPAFETIVVPALVELPSLSRRSLVSGAVRAGSGRLVCLLCARDEGLGDLVIDEETVGFIGLAGREEANDESFSMVVDLMGDRGKACELLDLGERTVVGAGLRDAVFVVAVGAAVAVFVRFLGLGISPWAYAFSLSSAPKCSLLRLARSCACGGVCSYLVLFKLFLVDDGAIALCRLSTTGMIAAGLGFAFSAKSSSRSCMLRFRSAWGILFTRISSLARRPCACNAY